MQEPTIIAKGTFNISLEPQNTVSTFSAPSTLGRMSLTKEFSGDLTATSIGEMLSVRTAQPTSAGYVAIEQVSGTEALTGLTGTMTISIENGEHFYERSYQLPK